MKVLITMLFECNVNDIIIYKTNPQKVWIITIKAKNIETHIKSLKQRFSMVPIEIEYVQEFDVVDTTKKVHEIIQKEKGNEIHVNVTEGRKTMFLGGVFAAALNKKDVEGAFYLRQDNHEMMPIPLPNFNLTENKFKILQQLDKGVKDVSEINKKVEVHRSLIYAVLKDLVDGAYITKDYDLTDFGKISLIYPDAAVKD